MSMSGALSIGGLLKHNGGKVLITWSMLVIEVALLALIPLFLGRAIDALLANPTLMTLKEISALFIALILVAVTRRAYDSRAYGTMRVNVGSALIERSEAKSTSILNAQLEMGRELVDFLEEQTPTLITCVIQLLVSIAILFSFGATLGISGIIAVAVMLMCYVSFHTRFFNINAELNAISERQVDVINRRDTDETANLLVERRTSEVRLSDADSVMYGLVYCAMFALILANLWSATLIPAITIGSIFAIISYSWELVGASVELPATLQQWTRLAEIQKRINRSPEDRFDFSG